MWQNLNFSNYSINTRNWNKDLSIKSFWFRWLFSALHLCGCAPNRLINNYSPRNKLEKKKPTTPKRNLNFLKLYTFSASFIPVWHKFLRVCITHNSPLLRCLITSDYVRLEEYYCKNVSEFFRAMHRIYLEWVQVCFFYAVCRENKKNIGLINIICRLIWFFFSFVLSLRTHLMCSMENWAQHDQKSM